ncbi:MAG TPA: hypothetical protein VHF23_00635 [Gaiellaceae bacterium]|nr:hypothetical protein [Gaiellaceae bacterium]
MPHWLTGALALLGFCYLVVGPLGVDAGASWVLAVASSIALGAWLRLAYGVTILERSEGAVTLRVERRGRSGRLGVRQRLGLWVVVGLVALLSITLIGSVLARKAESGPSSTSTPPRLDDSGRLPVIGGPSGKSRIEPRYSRVVSSVAGVRAEVRCWSVADWRRHQVAWGNWRGQELGPWGAYATRGRFRVHLSPAVCATLARLAYDDVPVREDPWPRELAWSVGALAHEAQHVRGVFDEGKAECFGVQSITKTAEALGRNDDEGRYLARLYWTSTYLARDSRYRPEECRDGGRLDRHPDTRAWP